ncbi:MAG: MaoC family dehydratase N-terminal domain-containing protein [Oscillospiraceae bacterium]|nr:MaoC family dehydratase N-terminal domain-containing protein [Oscillospiraceae bacterium]
MYFDQMKVGMTVEIPPVTIRKKRMLDFARLYDSSSLHMDEDYAKASPFGALIAPGVMSFMSVWEQYLDVAFWKEELLAGKSTKIEWHKPVYAEDVLHGLAEITALTPRSPRNGIVELTIKAYNQNNELVLTDVTEAIIRCSEI